MSHYNDPQESTPYEDDDLIVLAQNRLEDEFKEMSSERVLNFIASLELADVLYRKYHGEPFAFTDAVDSLLSNFISHYESSEIDLIVEESKQSAAEAYADYREDR